MGKKWTDAEVMYLKHAYNRVGKLCYKEIVIEGRTQTAIKKKLYTIIKEQNEYLNNYLNQDPVEMMKPVTVKVTFFKRIGNFFKSLKWW